MQVDIILAGDFGPPEVARLGSLAEGYGIRALWVSDYPAAPDPIIALSRLALESKRILVGALAINPYELHPLKMAGSLLTLNELSHGRACALIGAGGGTSGTTAGRRERKVRAVGECITIVRQAARAHAVDHQGEIYTVRRYRPAWAVSPPPLIYAAANKPQMLRMAARVADGVMVGDMTPAKLREALGILDAALAACGRSRADFRVSNFWAWHVKQDGQRARREACRELALRGMLNEWYLRPFLSETQLELVRAHRGAFFKAFSSGSGVIEGVPPEIVDTLVENLTCTGSLDDLDRHVERLREFARLGLSEIALRLHDDPEEGIRMIGEVVVPALQKEGSRAD